MDRIIEWISNNKEWVFSGAGVVVGLTLRDLIKFAIRKLRNEKLNRIASKSLFYPLRISLYYVDFDLSGFGGAGGFTWGFCGSLDVRRSTGGPDHGFGRLTDSLFQIVFRTGFTCLLFVLVVFFS